MNQQRSGFLILIGIMIFAASIFAFFVAESKESTAYSAEGGILNLQHWDHSKDEMIRLNGEWKFYPDVLDDDINIQAYSLVKQVPHFWESDSDLDFSPYGFGTYTLKVTGLKPLKIYGLKILDEVTAYKLLVNNEIVASNGTVSKERKTFEPQWQTETGVFQADKNGEARFVMEIANFAYYRGGFWNSIKIGNVGTIISSVNNDKVRDIFLFGTIFIIGLINLALFFVYKRDKTTLYFALFCFSMSFRILLIGQRLVSDLVSTPSWYILVRLEYLFGYLLLPLFGLFIIYLFEVKAHIKLIRNFFLTFIIAALLVSLITPNSVYTVFLEPYKWGGILFILYFAYLVGKAVKAKQAGSELILFAVLGVLISVIKENFIGGTVSWLPFATLNFVICFSLITFVQFLKIVKNNEVLEMKVVLDPLTGLFNRTYLMELDEFLQHEEEDQKKYLMFLDLDRFKEINDTYGHKTGDFILQETGQRLNKLLRNTDIICRYGGDEFIIIVSANRLEDIKIIAERIIQTIQQPFEKDGRSYNIGVSIGITEKNASIKNIEALIKNSDEAMYEAKRNGGNQYLFWNKAFV